MAANAIAIVGTNPVSGMPLLPLSPIETSTSDERISVMSVMPDTGFVPTMAMALAATVVKRKAITKTIASATSVCAQLPSTPNWKKTSSAASVAITTVRISRIVRSRCVRTVVCSAVFLPPSSFTASPNA